MLSENEPCVRNTMPDCSNLVKDTCYVAKPWCCPNKYYCQRSPVVGLYCQQRRTVWQFRMVPRLRRHLRSVQDESLPRGYVGGADDAVRIHMFCIGGSDRHHRPRDFLRVPGRRHLQGCDQHVLIVHKVGRLRRHRGLRRKGVHARIDRGTMLQRCRNGHGSKCERRAPLLHHPPSRVSRFVLDPRPAECVLRRQVNWRAVREMKASTDPQFSSPGAFSSLRRSVVSRDFPTLTSHFSAPRLRFQNFHVHESFHAMSIAVNVLLRGQLTFWLGTKVLQLPWPLTPSRPNPAFRPSSRRTLANFSLRERS